MTYQTLDKIILYGHGFTFEATLAALSKTLPENIKVIALEQAKSNNKDIFYGSITSPEAYDFHLSIGISEPDLIRNSDTNFAYGTHYQNWAGGLDWIQSYNLPFPIWQGVPFHHYLLRRKQQLQPYLVGAICGHKDRFAHPPSDPRNPLSRAEYGYQIKLSSLTKLLKKNAPRKNIIRKSETIKEIHMQDGKLKSIETKTGEHFIGQLYIDTTGHEGNLMEALGNHFEAERTLEVTETIHKHQSEGGSLREVSGEVYGWKSKTYLREFYACLSVAHPSQKEQTLTTHEDAISHQNFTIFTGRRPLGWVSNCIAIGHSSYIMEPLTPAPLMLLYKDIERMLSLIPHGLQMELERKEYNRLLNDDIENCEIFQRAFYEKDTRPKTAYWRDVTALQKIEKLNRKIKQFTSRGYLTKFDLEPFNEEDWTILHFGMQRGSQRHIDYTDSLPEAELNQNLQMLERSIQLISQKVPPHDKYLSNLLRYLEKKYDADSRFT